jgi:transcriptional regulator with XRE-family HTH domain
MKTDTLGQEIRRLRNEADETLRGFAKAVDVSAAHLSDIEHDRRRPSEALLRRIAKRLKGVGATLAGLERYATGLDPTLQEWVRTTPGARALLRKLLELSRDGDPHELLPAIEAVLQRKSGNGARRTRS